MFHTSVILAFTLPYRDDCTRYATLSFAEFVIARPRKATYEGIHLPVSASRLFPRCHTRRAHGDAL